MSNERHYVHEIFYEMMSVRQILCPFFKFECFDLLHFRFILIYWQVRERFEVAFEVLCMKEYHLFLTIHG